MATVYSRWLRTLLFPTCIGLAIAAALVLFDDLKSLAPQQRADQPQAEQAIAFRPLETPVQIERVHRRPLVQSITTNGRVRAPLQMEITAQVSGRAVHVRVREGSFVHKDSILVILDKEPFHIAYLKAQSRLSEALSKYAVRALLDGQTLLDRVDITANTRIDSSDRNDREAAALLSGQSRKKMIAHTAGLTEARLNLREAELHLQHTVIHAPFAGFVENLAVLPEEQVSPGKSLMQIIALDTLVIEAGVLETELQFVQPGAQAQVELTAFPGESFAGVVEVISPILAPESGICLVHIAIPNPELRIKPDMYAHITISMRVFQQRLLIPRDALLLRNDRKVIFVHQSGKSQWRYVKTGLENDDYIEIVEGLNVGEELIVSGHFNLAHDAAVVVVER